MSYTTIHQCANDQDFVDRVTAAVSQESWQNQELYSTTTAMTARQNPESVVNWFAWPIANVNEAAYEYAINASIPNPGKDPSVITDQDILSGVQYFWPDKPPVNMYPVSEGAT